jgi:hypothetical protein
MSISWPNTPHKCIISHMCAKRKSILRVGMLCIRYHHTVPVPKDEDYNLEPNTYEFFQENGLEGRFEIDLTEAIRMEVDEKDEMVVGKEDDEVQNENDLEMLEGLHLGNDNDELAHSDGVDYGMVDSYGETYDSTNPNHEEYF